MSATSEGRLQVREVLIGRGSVRSGAVSQVGGGRGGVGELQFLQFLQVLIAECQELLVALLNRALLPEHTYNWNIRCGVAQYFQNCEQ